MNKLYIYTKDNGKYVISENGFLAFFTLVGEYEYIGETPGQSFMDWFFQNNVEVDGPVIIKTMENPILPNTWDVEMSAT